MVYRTGVDVTIGDTPLVRVQTLRPQGGAQILLKLEGVNPVGNVMARLNGIGATNINEVIVINQNGIISRLIRMTNP